MTASEQRQRSSSEYRIRQAAVRLFAERGAAPLTVSELANEAKVARGTLYRSLGTTEGLFDRIVTDLSAEMYQRIGESLSEIADPAARLATGMRIWIRCAHDDPTFGRFAVTFGLTTEALRSLMFGPAMRDVEAGIAEGRFKSAGTGSESVASLMLGATVSAMWMVLEGHQTWRDGGSQTAELVLRAMGIDGKEARDLATVELPALGSL